MAIKPKRDGPSLDGENTPDRMRKDTTCGGMTRDAKVRRAVIARPKSTTNRPCVGLFPNAELTEDGVEQIFRGCLADDLANGVRGDAQLHRGDLQRLAVRK